MVHVDTSFDFWDGPAKGHMYNSIFPFLGTYVRGDVEVKLYQNNEREHVDEYSRD